MDLDTCHMEKRRWAGEGGVPSPRAPGHVLPGLPQRGYHLF